MRKETRYYKDTDGKIKSRVIKHDNILFERKSKPMKEGAFNDSNYTSLYKDIGTGREFNSFDELNEFCIRFYGNQNNDLVSFDGLYSKLK